MTYLRIRSRFRIGAALAAALGLTLLSAPAHAAPRDPWVRAWGQNNSGQLGNGSTQDQSTPSAVRGLARGDVRELTSGGWTTDQVFGLALMHDGTVQSWGGNVSGQLGDGTTANRGFPAAVAGLDGVTGVAAGLDFALALRGGRVLSWGSDAFGQLGDGLPDATGPVTRPVAVQSLDKVRSVAAGCQFGLALRQDGTVWTWGRNHEGQLGNGSTADRGTPRRVPGLDHVVAVRAGCRHALALTVDHTVKAWGKGSGGELGNDTTELSTVPVDVKELVGVSGLFAGPYHNFALLEDGGVRAWGENWAGQLGDGTKVKRTTPVPLSAPSGVSSLLGGWGFTLALLDDQSVVGWGANDVGQLGDGTTTPSLTPVVALPPGSGTTRLASATAWKSGYAY
ncbi:RCC1 domain-containing protein [Streptomyces showdoensis]|uniref:Chromosome condensation regulator RCC1 n=1 Tax=Streptomyces showdoensis TaxID=68268 RepID=A0A2P2GCF2_STREW|nr:chromosome condensation regulator RCC1 [Streptomyces showdoensis]KKZ69113.1 chromosome condensation regulator RCC1 [Streptomyces showdoensis]